MAQGGDDPVYQIAALCFDSKKFAVVVGSEIARLAAKRIAASFPGLLTLGVKRAADIKFKATSSGEKEHYIESWTKFISTNPLDVATEIATQLPVAKFKQWIKQELNLTIRNRRPTVSLKALQKLGAQLLTTNYDTLLESARIPRAVPGSDRMLNILSSDFNELQDLILGESQGILHLFGVFRECMLFTKSDHEDYIKNEEVMQHLGTLFYQSHILFVGFQKNDPFLNTLYGVMQKKLSKRLGNMKNRHYILVPDSELAVFNEGFPGILPLPYGSSDNELVRFLQEVIGQAIEAHHRGQKRRQDTYVSEPDAKRQRLCLIGEDVEVMHRISRLVQDDFQIPPEDIEVGKDRGQFASIYFTVDVAEQYVPLFWQQAQMTKNLLVQCGVMAIQVGSGPMLWMVNPYQPPPQPLAGQAQPGAGAIQQDDDQHGGWKRPKRKEWHQLPPLNRQLGHVRKTCTVRDVPKDSLPKLKKHIKEHFHCAVIYKRSLSDSATYHCQGERSNVDAAINYLANSQLAAKRGQRYSTWPKTLRQFACEYCDLVWWVRVPKERSVCLCPGCKICFKALKWADQYGFANFECQNCGQEFEGKDRFMHYQFLECPTCEENVRPYRIGPPHRKPTDSERPRNYRGSIPFSEQPKKHPRMPPRKPSKTDLNIKSKSQKEAKPLVLSQQAKEIVSSIVQVERAGKRSKQPLYPEEQSSHPIPLKQPISMNMTRTPKQWPDSTRNQLEPLPFTTTTTSNTDLRPLKASGLCTSKSKHQLKKEWKQQRKGKKQRTSRKVIPTPADRYHEDRQCDATVKRTSSIAVTPTRLEIVSDTLREEANELVVDTGSCMTTLVEANLLDHQEHSSDKELPTYSQQSRNKTQEAAASQELLRLIRTCGNDSTDPKVSMEANGMYNGGTEGPPSGAQSLEATLPVEGGATMRDHFHEETVPREELLQLPEHGDSLREEAKKLVDILLKAALETYSRCLARQESEDIANHVKKEIVVSGRNQSPNIAIVTTGNGHLDLVTTPIAPNQEEGESPTPQELPNESSPARHRAPAMPDLPPTPDEADDSVHKSSPQTNGLDKVTVLVQGTILESEVPCVSKVTRGEECHIVERTTFKEEAPKLESPEVPTQLICEELPIEEQNPQPLTVQMLQPSCPIKEEALPGTASHHPTTNELLLNSSGIMFGGISLQGTPEPEVDCVTNEGCQKHSIESASSTVLPVEGGAAMPDYFHEENVPREELLQLPEHGDSLREEAKKLVDILLKAALETYSRCLARQESEDIANHVKKEIVVSGRNQSPNIAIVTTGNGHLDLVTTPIAPNQEEGESPTPQELPNESSPARHRAPAMPDLPPTPDEADDSVHKSSPQTNGLVKVTVLVQGTILESEVPCVSKVTRGEECHIVERTTFKEEAPKLESPEVPTQLICEELPIEEQNPQPLTVQMLQPSCPIKEEALPGTASHHPTTNELLLNSSGIMFGGISLQGTPEPEVDCVTNEGCQKHSIESASSTVLPVEGGAAMPDYFHEENVPRGELLQLPEHGDSLREEAKKLVDILLKAALETYSRCLARQESEDIANHVKKEIVVSGRNQSPNIAIVTTGNGHLDLVTTPIAPNQEEGESPTPQELPNESSPARHRAPAMPDLPPTPDEADDSVHKSSPQTNGLDKVTVLVQGTIVTLESEVPCVSKVTRGEECHIVKRTTFKEEAPKLESPEVPMQLTCKELPTEEESPQPFTAQMLQPSFPIKEEPPGTTSHHHTTNELLLENSGIMFGGKSLQGTPELEVESVTNEGHQRHSLESASSTVFPVEGAAAMRDHFHEENVPRGELLQLPENGDTLREEAKKLVDLLLKTALETYSRCLVKQESEDIANHVKKEIVVSGRNQSPNIAIVTTGNGHLDLVTTPIAPNQEEGESPTPQELPNESSPARHRAPAMPDLPPTPDEADDSVHKSSPQTNGLDKVTVLVQGTIVTLESEVPCVSKVTSGEECHIVKRTTFKEEAPKLESPEVPMQLTCKELPTEEESPQPFTAQMLQPSCPIKEEAPGTTSHHPTTNELLLDNSGIMFGGKSRQGTPEPEVESVTNEGHQRHSLESASSTVLPVGGATAMRDHFHEENDPRGELLQLPENGDTLREEAKKLVDLLLKTALETYSRCLARPSDLVHTGDVRCEAEVEFKTQLPTVTNVCERSGVEIEEHAQEPNKTVHLLASKTNRVKGEQLNHQSTVQSICDKPVFVCSEDSVAHTLDHKLQKEVEHSPSDHTARPIDSSSSLFTLKQVPQEKHIQSTKEELPEQKSDKPIPSTQDNESTEHVSAAAGREEPLSQPQTDEITEICTIYGDEHFLGCSYEPIAEVQSTTAANSVLTCEGDMSLDGAKAEPGDKLLLPTTTMVEPISESDLVSEVTCASEPSLVALGKDVTSELEQLEAQGPNLDLKAHNVATCEPFFQDILGSESSKQLPSMVKKEVVTSLHSQPKETEVVPMDFTSHSHSDADTATNASAASSTIDDQGEPSSGIMDTEQVDTSTSANPQDLEPAKPHANEEALDTVELESLNVLSYATGGGGALESARAGITPNEDTEMGVQLEECSPSTMQQASNSEEEEGSKEVLKELNGVNPSMEATSEVSVHCSIHEQSSEEVHLTDEEIASTDEGRVVNETELQHSDITAPSKVQEKNDHIQMNINEDIEVSDRSELHASILNKTASDIHDTGMPEAPHPIVIAVKNTDIETSEPIEEESSIVVEVEDLPHQTESKGDAFKAPTLSPSTDIFESPETTKEALEIHDDTNLPNQTPPPSQSEQVTPDNLNEGTSSDSEVQQLIESILSQLITAAVDSGISTTAPQQVNVIKPEIELPAADDNIPLVQRTNKNFKDKDSNSSHVHTMGDDGFSKVEMEGGNLDGAELSEQGSERDHTNTSKHPDGVVSTGEMLPADSDATAMQRAVSLPPTEPEESSDESLSQSDSEYKSSENEDKLATEIISDDQSKQPISAVQDNQIQKQKSEDIGSSEFVDARSSNGSDQQSGTASVSVSQYRHNRDILPGKAQASSSFPDQVNVRKKSKAQWLSKFKRDGAKCTNTK